MLQPPELLYHDDSSEIWLGNSLDPEHAKIILGDRVANALIFDAPYSEKTHSGHANGKLTSDRAAAFAARHSEDPNPSREVRYAARKSAAGESGRRDIDYPHFTPEDCAAFSAIWVPKCSGWVMSITDDVLTPVWRDCFESHDRYPFCPLPLVETGSRVRMTGDGPSNWTCWCVVARPKNREYASWGTLRGAYVQPGERKINSRGGSTRVVGGKPLRSMLAIVEDYSRKGDLIVDPCVGAGTTCIAAKMQGRRSIGIDSDPEHAELAVKALRESKEQGSFQW